MAKKPVGVVPANWSDDKIIAWARAKHVTRVYPGAHIAIAKVEQRDIVEPPLSVLFEEATNGFTEAETVEEQVAILGKAMSILGKKQFGIDPNNIVILRDQAGGLEEEDDEDVAELYFCRQDGCNKGPKGGARFFDTEEARDGHEASAHRVKELATA